MLHLSPEFNYVVNTVTDRAFIVSNVGGVSVINTDAMELLADPANGWTEDPAYASFLAAAVAQGWLVGEPPTRAPRIRRIATAHHLRRVQYEVNLVCNLECAHCYCSASPRAPRGESTEFVLRVVRQAAAMGVIFFDVTGGEPLARDDIFEVLGAIREAGMVPGLFTNATLVTPAVAARLRDLGVANVQSSLDARTPDLHDKFRGKRGAFHRAEAGILALKEAGLNVSVSICASKMNAHELPDLHHYISKELGLPLRLDRVIPAGRGIADGIALPETEFYQLARLITGGGEDMPLVKVCDSPSDGARNGSISPGCGVGESYVFIKHDGRVALCPTMTEAESPDFGQGSLHELGLEDIWLHHPTFTRFRGMQCQNATRCPSGRTCRGGCRSNAYILHGTVDSPDEMSCNLHKNPTDQYIPYLERYAAERGVAPRAATTGPRTRMMLPVVQ